MKNLAARVEKFVARRESIPSAAIHVVIALLFISIVRLGLENLPNEYVQQEFILFGIISLLVFYVGTFFLFLRFVAFFFPNEITKVRSVVLIGMFGGLVPPFITPFFSSDTAARYSYFKEFTWNFFASTQPIGESIGLWLTIAIVCIYFWYRKKNFLYFLVGLAGSYTILQFSGWFIIVPAVPLTHILSDARPDISSLFAFSTNFLWVMAALAAFISTRYRFFAATLKRFQHTGIRLILVLFGAQLAGGANFLSLLEGIIFMLAFMLIQAENDYYDKELDAATLRASSITQDDLIFVRVFMALLALIFWFIQPLFSILLVIFFLLGFVYNHPAFRFKKYFITASLVEGGAAFIGMFAGVFSAGNSLDGTDILWITGVALIFAVLANIRDYKDFIGDKKMGIKTLYVTLQARGVAPQKTHFALIGFSIFIHIVVVAFSLYLHLALPLIVIGFLLLIASPFPFLLISHPKKSASSTSTVAQAGLLLLFVAFGMLPAFSHQYPHHPEIIREQPQELPPAY